MSFTIKDILHKSCSYDNCHKNSNEWGEYCDIHDTINNINIIINNRNPGFKFHGLLNYKLNQILSQIQEELDEEMLDVQQHQNTIYIFNTILYKCIGLKLDREILEYRDFYLVLNEYLKNLCCESQIEGPIESEINRLVNDMELVVYIKN